MIKLCISISDIPASKQCFANSLTISIGSLTVALTLIGSQPSGHNIGILSVHSSVGSHMNSIIFAAELTTKALKKCNISSDEFKSIHLGITIPQKHSFYGTTWFSGLIGAPDITGPMIAQACATSARLHGGVASEIEAQANSNHKVLAVTCDRTSNGPQLSYPNPFAPGGKADV